VGGMSIRQLLAAGLWCCLVAYCAVVLHEYHLRGDLPEGLLKMAGLWAFGAILVWRARRQQNETS
jgi:hypothetical protein